MPAPTHTNNKRSEDKKREEREEREADLPRWKAQTFVFAHSNQRACQPVHVESKTHKATARDQKRRREEKRRKERKRRGASRPHCVQLRKLKKMTKE
jgi:hypothetical protein